MEMLIASENVISS